MIQHLTHVFTGLAGLEDDIVNGAIAYANQDSSAQLVQIYSGSVDKQMVGSIVDTIKSLLPNASIVGATTSGEVASGLLKTRKIVIGFTFFEATQLKVLTFSGEKGEEAALAAQAALLLVEPDLKLAAVLALVTAVDLDAPEFLQGLEQPLGGVPLFGGGAGTYEADRKTFVINEHGLVNSSVAVVGFYSDELSVYQQKYLGWQPLSKSMNITELAGRDLISVDNSPALDVYRRYLKLSEEDDFFSTTMAFPFLFERGDDLIARVPISVEQNGVLRFTADIHQESFRIGYGNIDEMVQAAHTRIEDVQQFSPEAIFVFSCVCRRYLMQDSVNLETEPLESVAPTFGFYTFGEFQGQDEYVHYSHCITTACLREGDSRALDKQHEENSITNAIADNDPYINQHAKIVSHLLTFADAVTAELEESVKVVSTKAEMDALTKLANRMSLDQALAEQITEAEKARVFSAILIDIDHFKQINDSYGHLAGDHVLVRTAEILNEQLRSNDLLGRWGGEEFLVLVSDADADGAQVVAEKLRAALDAAEFDGAGHVTASFGVAEYRRGDTAASLVARADAALYVAKRSGRNCVHIGR